MEAINHIKKNNKEYIGNIDYSYIDENNNTYFYYNTIFNYITNNINDINNSDIIKSQNNNDIIFNDKFKDNFIIISIDENNKVKIQYLLTDKTYKAIFFLYDEEHYRGFKPNTIKALFPNFSSMIKIINNKKYNKKIKTDIIKYIKERNNSILWSHKDELYDIIFYYYRDIYNEENDEDEYFLEKNKTIKDIVEICSFIELTYSYENNKLIIDLNNNKFKTLGGSGRTLKCFQNVFIKSNNNIQKIILKHNNCICGYHDSIKKFINVYIDYMPNLKNINMKSCNIFMNKCNININKILFSNINNNFINNLINLKKIYYYKPKRYDVHTYPNIIDNIEQQINNNSINKLSKFMINNNLEYINIYKTFLEIDKSFNGIITCFNSGIFLNNDVNINKLILKEYSCIETADKKYFINHLIINKDLINDFNNYQNVINCSKIDIYITNYGYCDFEKIILKPLKYNLQYLKSNDLTLYIMNKSYLKFFKNNLPNYNIILFKNNLI